MPVFIAPGKCKATSGLIQMLLRALALFTTGTRNNHCVSIPYCAKVLISSYFTSKELDFLVVFF